ncbi:MAG: peptidyl-prolyl cis-trans isomerase [Burkholderiales bacterium]|jgi:peptidyl-prolyl cis-trans isomerase C|nr:peptidyl-prolyl cis-trans isomerase [Burkholderiales bacterium]
MTKTLLRGLAIAALASASTAVLAQNLAVVNNRPIPKAREDAWVSQLKQQGQQDTPQLREMIKQELIRREVFLQEASRRGIAERPDVKFQLDVQRQNTLIQALMRDELDKRPITDAEVAAAYEQQKKQMGEREYRARHILVEKEDEAKQIIEQLKRGAKFEELAKKSKDTGSAANGGDLDWAAPDAYVKPFSEALVKLQKGQITEVPVQSQFGWHVIRLDDVRDAQVPPLAQVAPQIREALQQQRVQGFADELRKKAKVQ